MVLDDEGALVLLVRRVLLVDDIVVCGDDVGECLGFGVGVRSRCSPRLSVFPNWFAVRAYRAVRVFWEVGEDVVVAWLSW